MCGPPELLENHDGRAPRRLLEVDRYLREHERVDVGTLLVVTALVWALASLALGDTTETAVIEGAIFGGTVATLAEIGRRAVSSDGSFVSPPAPELNDSAASITFMLVRAHL